MRRRSRGLHTRASVAHRAATRRARGRARRGFFHARRGGPGDFTSAALRRTMTLGNAARRHLGDWGRARVRVLLSDRIVMLTNGPNARIGEILEVDLPRPRNRLALAADPRFVAARASVLEFLHHRHTAPGLAAA